MILYTNGCSHTAAAEAVNSAAFAQDDWQYRDLGRRPHPDNLEVSWCTHVARDLGWDLVCDAESASSNDRIIRTTQDWFDHYTGDPEQVVAILQWSTWERQEWLHDGVWYQINASGIDDVPPSLQQRYREFVVNVNWPIAAQDAHRKIWDMHEWLLGRGIKHLFFNGNSTFHNLGQCRDWHNSYVNPYDHSGSFDAILRSNGYSPVNPNSYHYGADAHCFWAKYLLQYMHSHTLLG